MNRFSEASARLDRLSCAGGYLGHCHGATA
jgi:hypothetical protein